MSHRRNRTQQRKAYSKKRPEPKPTPMIAGFFAWITGMRKDEEAAQVALATGGDLRSHHKSNCSGKRSRRRRRHHLRAE